MTSEPRILDLDETMRPGKYLYPRDGKPCSEAVAVIVPPGMTHRELRALLK